MYNRILLSVPIIEEYKSYIGKLLSINPYNWGIWLYHNKYIIYSLYTTQFSYRKYSNFQHSHLGLWIDIIHSQLVYYDMKH